MSPRRDEQAAKALDPLLEQFPSVERIALDESNFRRVIAIERKRTERSKAPFVLMLLEAMNHQEPGRKNNALERIMTALLSSSRDTDTIGWYKDGTTVGAIFTGLGAEERNTVLSTILSRVTNTLRNELPFDQFSQISIALHFFPDDWNDQDSGRPNNPTLYPDLTSRDKNRKPLLILKRSIDIVGSLVLLLLSAPLWLAIAVAIKATSRGPVFFKQQRVGQYGRSFTFLKFRSMYVNNDSNIHRNYVTQLISSEDKTRQKNGNAGIYKIVNDSRVTPLGRFLRRSSLDELPQFINVLKGDMSLVGPRPPIPYELAAYQTWHRRRLLEVKPGLTGLWQVTGRSTVNFDEMVRLDLRYATSWTPMLDLKILLRTPLAVIKGSGAF